MVSATNEWTKRRYLFVYESYRKLIVHVILDNCSNDKWPWDLSVNRIPLQRECEDFLNLREFSLWPVLNLSERIWSTLISNIEQFQSKYSYVCVCQSNFCIFLLSWQCIGVEFSNDIDANSSSHHHHCCISTEMTLLDRIGKETDHEKFNTIQCINQFQLQGFR